MDINRPLVQYPVEKVGVHSNGEVNAHELKLELIRSVTGTSKSNVHTRTEWSSEK